MKVILGTGQTGLAVMERYCQISPNAPILMVNRSGKVPFSLPANVQIAAADATQKKDMEAMAQKAEVIFNCTDMPYQIWDAFYPATAAALAHALSKTRAKLVFADNLYSYGNVMGAEMHEKLPHQAHTRKGAVRAAVIQTLLCSGQAFNERVAFVKASDLIGPRIHKGGFGTDFLQRLTQNKRIALFGRVKMPHTFTYIHDFATAMVNVGSAADAFGQIWHVPNAPAIDLLTWVQLFETEFNQKANTLSVPKALVWAAGWFDPLLRELYELAYQYEHPYLVNHDRYVARFGNHSTHPLTIVQATARWYAAHQNH